MRKSKYTKQLLEPIVKESNSVAQVIKKLNLTLSGGNYRMITHRIRFNNIDMSHFIGKFWARGLTKETSLSIKKSHSKNSYSNEQVFIKNSPLEGGQKLTPRLLKLNWLYKCKECGLSEWRGNKIQLHLDHINGIHNDNRYENLRFICPNCHQQTETWGNKNRGSVAQLA